MSWQLCVSLLGRSKADHQASFHADSARTFGEALFMMLGLQTPDLVLATAGEQDQPPFARTLAQIQTTLNAQFADSFRREGNGTLKLLAKPAMYFMATDYPGFKMYAP